jgi:hypothetical protein
LILVKSTLSWPSPERISPPKREVRDVPQEEAAVEDAVEEEVDVEETEAHRITTTNLNKEDSPKTTRISIKASNHKARTTITTKASMLVLKDPEDHLETVASATVEAVVMEETGTIKEDKEVPEALKVVLLLALPAFPEKEDLALVSTVNAVISPTEPHRPLPFSWPTCLLPSTMMASLNCSRI